MVLLSMRRGARLACGGTLALLLVAGPMAASTRLAIPALAGDALSCEALAQHLGANPKIMGASLSVDGPTRRVEADSAPHQVTLCGAPAVAVLCVTEAAEERQVGERLIVTGTVSEASADFLRLEPCVHRAP